MPKAYHISEINTKKSREAMKSCKEVEIYRRLKAVALRGEGKKNGGIGSLVGFHPDRVSKLVY